MRLFYSDYDYEMRSDIKRELFMSPEVERFLSTLRNHTKPILRLEQPLSNAIRKCQTASKLFLLAMLSLIPLWFRVWTP